MSASWRRRTMAVKALVACGLVVAVGAGGAPADAAPAGRAATTAGSAPGIPSVAAAGQVQLAIPQPTGDHPVGVRSTFLEDAARTEPTTGGPRAIPVRVWYP